MVFIIKSVTKIYLCHFTYELTKLPFLLTFSGLKIRRVLMEVCVKQPLRAECVHHSCQYYELKRVGGINLHVYRISNSHSRLLHLRTL